MVKCKECFHYEACRLPEVEGRDIIEFDSCEFFVNRKNVRVIKTEEPQSESVEQYKTATTLWDPAKNALTVKRPYCGEEFIYYSIKNIVGYKMCDKCKQGFKL